MNNPEHAKYPVISNPHLANINYQSFPEEGFSQPEFNGHFAPPIDEATAHNQTMQFGPDHNFLEQPQFIQAPFYPQENQYQFIEAPHIDDAPLTENNNQQVISRNTVLQCLHSNAVCKNHKKNKIMYVCQAPVCRERLLCETCVKQHTQNCKDHADSILTMKDFFNDNELLVMLEKLSQEGLSFDTLESMHIKLVTSMITTFDQTRNRVLKLLRDSEEEAKEMARNYIISIKDPKAWTYVRRDYTAKKEAYLSSSIGVQTKELDNLIEVMNRIRKRESAWEANLAKTLKSHQNNLDKFVSEVQAGLKNVLSTFSPAKADQIQLNPPKAIVKIDPSLVTYQKELKVDHKFIFNAMTYMVLPDQLVTGSDLGVLSFWHPKTLKPVSTVQPHKDVINSILYIEREGALLTASKDKTIGVYSVNNRGVASGSLSILKGHSAAVKSLLYLGDGMVASGGEDPDIRIWNLNTKSLEGTIKTKGWAPKGDEMVYILPEKWIAASGNQEIRIYDYTTKEFVMSQSLSRNIASMSLCLTEQKYLAAQSNNDTITIWKINHIKKSLSEEKKLKLPEATEDAIYFRCFEDCDLMFVALRNKQVLIYNLATGKLIHRFHTRLHQTSCITPVNKYKRLFVGDSRSNLLGILDY